MKRLKFVLLFTSLICAFYSLTAQPIVKTEQLLQLGEGESFLIAESSAGMICSAGQLCITTYHSSSKNFYVYQNGIKNGPYLKNNIEQYMCKGDLPKHKNLYSAQGDFDINEYYEYLNDGTVFIVLNGQKFGPYANIMNMQLSPDKNNFIAVIMNTDMTFTVASSLCNEFNIEGTFSNVSFNNAGTKFLLTVECESDINKILNEKMMSLQGKDLSDEDMMKLVQEITDLQNNASAEQNLKKNYIYTENGLKLGPYDTESFSQNNPTFLPESGNNWVMTQSHKLFINGTEVKDFGEDYPNTNEFYLSKDGKSYAAWFYDKLILNDDREYKFPVYVNYCNNQLVWLCLENDNQLVKYSVQF
ncbi:MAG TPA: hypothetical protein PLL66_09370 [Bacteroidales bacterium]|nr:hypothetical protein [Bacteroidales bacterium]